LAAQTPAARAVRTVKAATKEREDPHPGRWAAKTYNYLRLGMLVAVAALGYSIVKEYRQPGTHCFLGSISGYYHTPARPIFIGAMVAIGFALIVIKGRTAIEDGFLTLAGIMAPIVAFIPTSDDKEGVCRQDMLDIRHYQPAADLDTSFVGATINNNLHTLVFAGYVAVVLVVIAFLIRGVPGSPAESKGLFWINVAGGLALALMGSILLRWAYDWVLEGHAKAAVLMFGFLALAAITNSVLGFVRGDTSKLYALTYGLVGAAMITSGIVFLVLQLRDQAGPSGHSVLIIEFVEISLFAIFWGAQTLERWNQTVMPRSGRPDG
jgi:hypothetical protein